VGGLPGTDRLPPALRPRWGGDEMPLIQLIVVLIVIGLVLYLVEMLLPLDPAIKQVIRVVVVLAVILWLLSLVGLIPARVGMVPVWRPYG
jgi:hypothetical protein